MAVEREPRPEITDEEFDRLQREFEQRNPHVVEAMRVLGMSMRSYAVAMQAIHGGPALTAGSGSDQVNVVLE